MTEKLKQIIKDEVDKLPKEIQEVVNAFGWVDVTEEIGKRFLMDERELNNFQVETLLVLVGIESGDLYAKNIEDEVGISRDEAEKIANEAFEKIFTPMSNILTENIKKSLGTKDPSWDQTLDFILSGGDYSAFLEQEDAKPRTQEIQNSQSVNNVNTNTVAPPTLADIKTRVGAQKRNTQRNTSKMTDLKSKFTI